MKVAIVFDTPYADWGPEDYDSRMREEIAAWDEIEPEQEYQIGNALEQKGHQVVFVGVKHDLNELLDTLKKFEVEVVFNLTEAFRDNDGLDFLVPAMLEAEGYPYTGASPQALMVTRNKALSKKILLHHGIRVPKFMVYRLGETPRETDDLSYPAIVKPLQMDGSVGISKASVVRSFEALQSRVAFVHERFSGAAIAEEFIDGRELYAGVFGNGSDLQVLPLTELVFDKNTRQNERIATKSAKWNEPYRQRKGIKNQIARPVSRAAQERIEEACRVAFRSLWLRDYARLDLRLIGKDDVCVIEANANPFLSYDHEYAMAAEKAGMEYKDLIDRILRIAVARHEKTAS